MVKTAKSLGFKRFLLATACLPLLAGPAFGAPNKPKHEKERPAPAAVAPAAVGEALSKPNAELRPGLAGSFLSGRFAKHNQDLKEAARYLEQTLAHDPQNESLQQETMRMQLLAGNVEAATKLAKTLAQNKNNDPLIASLLMLEAVKADDFVTARTTIEQAPGAGLFGLIRPVMLEWIAVAEEDKKHVVDLQAAMDKAGFFAPFINYHVEKVKAESEKKEVADILVANRELGDKLQVRGTPLLVIGDEIIPHAVGLEELESRLNALKAEAAKAE